MRGARLLLRGLPQAEVARRLAVTRRAVCNWSEQLRTGGLRALKRRPRGRPSGLDAEQRVQLARRLRDGAHAQASAPAHWTLQRVGQLIEENFGRRYSASQVWRILAGLDFKGLHTRNRRLRGAIAPQAGRSVDAQDSRQRAAHYRLRQGVASEQVIR
jgi:transposase